MKNSEEDIDKGLTRALRQRFDTSEAPVDPGLYKSIRKRLGLSGRYVALPVLLLLLITVLFLRKTAARRTYERHKTTGVERASKSFSVPVAKGNALSMQSSPIKVLPSLKADHMSWKVSQKKTSSVPVRQREKIALPAMVQLNHPIFEEDRNPLQTALAAITSSSDSSQPFTRIAELARLNPIDSLSQGARELVMPHIAPQPMFEHSSHNGKRGISWIIAVSPMQNFQALRIRSEPFNHYHDIRFPSMLSLRAKTIQLKGGIEIKGFQFLAHYAYARNTIFYRKGTGKFKIQPVPNGVDKIAEIVTPETLDESLRRIGLGISRTINFRYGPRHTYKVMAGIQYDHTLRQGQSAVWANIGIFKKLNTFSHKQLFIGPSAEIGLHRQNASLANWQYRPSQIGITAIINISPTLSKHLISK